MASLEDQYQKAVRLYTQESANDPHTEPYKSKYAAREIFEELKSRLSKQLDEDDVEGAGQADDGEGVTRARMAAVSYHLGVIALGTEELSTGEEHLKKALRILGDDEGVASGVTSATVGDEGVFSAAMSGDVDSLISNFSSSTSIASVNPLSIAPSSVALTVACHNHLGILWSQRNTYHTAKLHLDRANAIYEEYRRHVATPPRTIHSLFAMCSGDSAEDDSGAADLEKLHTLTYYYLAQVYGYLNQPDKSAWHCHWTLQRQLTSKDYDPVDWAINAAMLAQYYQGKEKFKAARHLLAAASKVLKTHEEEIRGAAEDCEDQTERQERVDTMYKKRCADVARGWGRYCLQLLQVSCERAEEGLSSGGSAEEHTSSEESESDGLDTQLEFPELEVSDIEAEVGADFVGNFDSARPLFLAGLRWLTDARGFYTLDDHASDHVAITKDLSQLYKALAYFEQCEERRAKMNKRRVDLLQAIVQELNPTYYLHICRQLHYELAETYAAMMDCKLAVVGDGVASPQQAKKINLLATSAIQNFLNYLDSMKDSSTGEQPERYTDESVRPVLIAWFHLGRLWSKLISPNAQGKLQNMAHSLQNYKRVVSYCEQHPEVEPVVAQEVAICRELTQLLALKMEQMRAQI